MHLLIPFAACSADACQQALQTLQLPHLQALLARLTPTERDPGDDYALSLPHERALARALALPAEDGRIPWAARERLQTGADVGTAAWALITPCHWRLATDHALLLDPAELALTAPESQALLAAMAPYFAEDGINLYYARPDGWHAEGEVFRALASASLERVRGRSLDLWLPEGPQARVLRRLQSEMQMLLYTHPVNDAREARGLLPVNAFWVSGTGAWPGGPARTLYPPSLQVPQTLAAPALRADWSAWASAWQQLDAGAGAELLAHVRQHGQGTLTLCGERSSQQLQAKPRSLGAHVASIFSRQRASDILSSL